MRVLHSLICVAAGAASAAGQGAPAAPVPVRDLGPVVATTTERFRLFFGLWEYADGRVLIGDGARFRLTLFDSTLAAIRVVADTGGAPLTTTRISVPLVPYLSDSTLFIDFASSSFLVLGPGGTVARTMAPPKVADLQRIRSGASGIDGRGRIVYRGFYTRPSGMPPEAIIDSAPILRGDFDTRKVDTIGAVKTAAQSGFFPVRGADGKCSFKEIDTPVQSIDEWAVHADGSIAMLRGHDYHIDWIDVNGKVTSTPKMPFDWRRITDDDKRRMTDSMRARWDSLPATARTLTMGEAGGRCGSDLDQIVTLTAADGSKVIPLAMEVVPFNKIPDYVPPIRAGAMKADRVGNLWILPATSAQSRKGGLVYDIVSRNGVLTERVELPAGRSIAGFGAGGNVYLLSGDRTRGFTIERARFK